MGEEWTKACSKRWDGHLFSRDGDVSKATGGSVAYGRAFRSLGRGGDTLSHSVKNRGTRNQKTKKVRTAFRKKDGKKPAGRGAVGQKSSRVAMWFDHRVGRERQSEKGIGKSNRPHRGSCVRRGTGDYWRETLRTAYRLGYSARAKTKKPK